MMEYQQQRRKESLQSAAAEVDALNNAAKAAAH
jgi:hypothetical protein